VIRRPIPLATGAARCPSTRAKPCMQASSCARGLAPHEPGRPVMDFSVETRGPGGRCGWFTSVQYADATAPQPRVHDAPEGLR
jgi:hypothetical protein